MHATVAPPASAAALVPGWVGSRAYDAEGARIGYVADVLFDALTAAPGWVLLALPRVEDRFVLAPAAGLRHGAQGVHLACDRALVRTAPTSAAPPDGLGRTHARALAAHYGIRCGNGPWNGVVEPWLVGVGGRMRVAG